MSALIPVTLALLFMGVRIWLDWPLWQTSFGSDNSPVSWLSSAQLCAGAMVALRLGLERNFSWRLSLWLTSALIYLALDEQFLFHEQWKYGCESWLVACRHASVREFPTLAVGALGVLSVAWLQRALGVRISRAMLWVAVAIGVCALWTDLRPVLWLPPGSEEGIEVLAEAVFVGALLGVRSARDDQVHSV